MVNKLIDDRAKKVLVLTGLGSRDACGEVQRSKIDSVALNEFVIALDEEIFMTSLLSPGQVWSTHAYFFLDCAKSHPTGNEALIQKIQALPMRVMFEESHGPKVQVKTLLFDKIEGFVHYIKRKLKQV